MDVTEHNETGIDAQSPNDAGDGGNAGTPHLRSQQCCRQRCYPPVQRRAVDAGHRRRTHQLRRVGEQRPVDRSHPSPVAPSRLPAGEAIADLPSHSCAGPDETQKPPRSDCRAVAVQFGRKSAWRAYFDPGDSYPQGGAVTGCPCRSRRRSRASPVASRRCVGAVRGDRRRARSDGYAAQSRQHRR